MLKKFIKNKLDNYSFVRGDINLNDRNGMLHRVWGYVFSNHLFGDYIEFGVYKGDSFAQSINQYKKFKLWLKDQKKSSEAWRVRVAQQSELNNEIYFHGLDTFEGMPSNNEKSIVFSKGNFYSSYEEVKKKINKLNQKFFLYKGLFLSNKNQIKNNLKNRKAAIVNFDCDLYQSTIDAFEIIDENLQIGTALIFDDYNSFSANNSEGQRRALKEIQDRYKWIIEPFFHYMYIGQVFLIVGKK